MTTKTFADLNALRIDLGMAPLKSWKESNAKLTAAYDKLNAKKTELVAKAPKIETISDAVTAIKETKVKKSSKDGIKEILAPIDSVPLTKKAADAKKPAKDIAEIKAAKGDEEISVSTIAEECDMDAKVARAKLRRIFGKKELGKWPTSIVEIKKVLKSDARKDKKEA